MSRNEPKKTLNPKEITSLIDTAIQELIKAWNMTPAEHLEHSKKEMPGFPFPSNIVGFPFTHTGDVALARWAGLMRANDAKLFATSDAESWGSLVRQAFLSAIQEARKLTDPTIEVVEWLMDRGARQGSCRFRHAAAA